MGWQQINVFANFVVVSGTAGEGVFVYSGTPGAGNPPVSYMTAPGVTTDPYGNNLPIGGGVVSVSYTSPDPSYAALESGQISFQGPHGDFAAAFIAASTEAAGILGVNSGLASNTDIATFLLIGSALSGNDGLAVFDGADENTYDTEQLMTYLTTDRGQCSSETQSTILGPVNISGTYWFEADIFMTTQSVNSMFITMGGSTVPTSFGAWVDYNRLPGAAANDPNSTTVFQATLGNNTGLGSGTTVSGQTYKVHIQGFISGAGTLTVNQASSANAASFTVKQGSVLRLYPQRAAA
jgi:hypothetical protein